MHTCATVYHELESGVDERRESQTGGTGVAQVVA